MNSESQLPPLNLDPRVRGLELSPTLEINERSAALRAEGRRIYGFGLGQSPFPVPDAVVDALRANAHQRDYLPVRGLPELRAAVAADLRRRQGIDRSPDDVLIGPGSKELIFLLQLAHDGGVLIPTPAWVSYVPQTRILRRAVRLVPARRENGYCITAEELEDHCAAGPDRPRMLVLNYPSNPTGTTFSTEQLAALAGVARRFGLVVLSDEIYGELHHEGGHVSFARFYPEGTIVSDGLSKWCGAGGWRLGTFVFPPELRGLLDAMAAVASETFTSTAAPIQFAAARAFERGPAIEEYTARSRRVLRTLGRALAARLHAVGAEMPNPQGAFYLFPDFSPWAGRLASRGIQTSTQLATRLLDETGVALLSGSAFARPESEQTARLAYVDFDGAAALAAAAAAPADRELDPVRLHDACAGVFEGIDRLCAWLGPVE